MTDKTLSPLRSGEFVLYPTPSGDVQVSVYFDQETAWLPQKAVAEVFGVNVPAISKHLKNIFETGELDEHAVVSILETTADDGKTYRVRHYNLDAVIAVGCREIRTSERRIYQRIADIYATIVAYGNRLATTASVQNRVKA